MKSKSIPLFIFDEHNEAFYYWHKARHDGYLNEPLDLFHIDAHSDMDRKSKLRRSIYHSNHQGDKYLEHYEDISKNELGISNFILPAVLNGIIRNIYFIFPKWRGFKSGRKRINISSAFGEGKVLKFDLKIEKDTDPKVYKAFPDLTFVNYSMLEIDRIPKNRKAILDFDLDYFACNDSILNHMTYELEITRDQFTKAVGQK